MDEAVRRLRPDVAAEAAGYIRVSTRLQTGGHSPQTQRDAIRRLAQQEGFVLTIMEEDSESGTRTTRAGYQKILSAVVRFVDRWPATRPGWARAEVTWTPDVQTLLNGGLLKLSPAILEPGEDERARIRAKRSQQRRGTGRRQQQQP